MKEKLLIVGDDLIHAKEWYETLEESFDISVVSDGSSALEKLTQTQDKVQVMLLSLVLPRIDGYQVLRYMKSMNCPKNVRVVAMTAAETYQIHLNEFAGLVDETVKKPETLDEIENLKDTLLLAC